MALVAPTGMALIRGFLPDILQHKVCGRQCRSCKRFYLFEIISIKTEVKWKLVRACFHSYQAADILIENNNDNNNNDNNQLHTYIHTYTLFKLEIQCSCRANIFEKKAKNEIKICYLTISILFINYIQLKAKREN